MKTKMLLLGILLGSLFVIGCIPPQETICNYDGVCDDWETDNCVDCIDVLGRGVQVVSDSNTNEDFVLP